MAREINLAEGRAVVVPLQPLGDVDAFIPDPVCHFLGTEDNIYFRRALGRMVDFEVAVLLGCGRGGGIEDSGYTIKPTGHCTPLGMRPLGDAADG